MEPSTAASDSEHVFLSIQPPNIHEPIPLLRIPHAAFPQYSTKPRKWLQYTGFAITGKQGELFQDPRSDPELKEEQEPYSCDLELEVEAGDRFIYRINEEPVLFDWRLRPPGDNPQASLTSNSTTAIHIRDDAKAAYDRCPFTSVPEIVCDACHLIPRDRGDSYMRELYRLRGNEDSAIDIDDAKNVLFLDVGIHRGLDAKLVAFLKTPNYALKSNEVVLNGQDENDAEAYRVTLHCFSTDENDLRCFSHGTSSSLIASRRPEDFIFDVVYACNLFSCWGVSPNEFVEKERKRLFGDDELEYGEGPAGEKARQDAWIKKQAKATRRAERHERRVRSGNAQEPLDAMDYIMMISLWANNTSIAEMEAHDRALEEEERQRKMRETEAWVRGEPSG